MLKGILAKKELVWAALFFHLILLFNLKFTAWPEMLAWPYLILKGWLPYRDIAIAHTPLLLADLAIFFKVLGVGLWQLKAYTWILILILDCLVYWVSKKIWDKKTAAIALLLFIPLQLFYEGNGLWFDLALAPLGLLIYLNLKNKNYLWAGVFFGLSLLTKQTAMWFLPPAFFMVFRDSKKKLKDAARFAEGLFVPLLAIFLIGGLLGITWDFWKWAVNFGVLYLPGAPGQVALPELRQLLRALLPLAIMAVSLFQRKKESIDLVVWGLFASFGAYPRFEMFHFQPAVPFLAIAIALFLVNLINIKLSWGKYFLAGYLVLILALVGRFVVREWGRGTRFFEPEVLKIASLVKQADLNRKSIYVLNYWDSLYALTDTLPASKPLVPYLPWYLRYQSLEKGLYEDIVLMRPELIVKGKYAESGLGSYRIPELDDFIKKYYSSGLAVGEVEIFYLNK